MRGVYPFGEGSVLVLDLNAQYIYYYEAFRDAILGGKSLFYSFGRTLGGEMVGIFAYYLASPFSWIFVVFPKHLITEAIMVMILLKIGFSGMAFCHYIRRSKGAEPYPAVLFSTMYALMAYGVVQTMNPMWLDALIWFPLIALAVEHVVNTGDFKSLTIYLAAMFVSHFYIGYMVGIFTFVYFLYAMVVRPPLSKDRWKRFASFSVGAIWAILLSAWLLLPTYYSLTLGKLSFTDPNYFPRWQLDLFDLYAKMLPLTYDSVNYQGLPFIYAGTLTLFLAGVYFFTRSVNFKDRLAAVGFLGVMAMCFAISTVDIVLHGFQAPNWLNYRYAFIFSFFMVMLAYQGYHLVSEWKPEDLLKLFGGLAAGVVISQKIGYSFVNDHVLAVSIGAMVGIAALFIFLKDSRYRRLFPYLLALLVISEASLNTYMMIEGAHREVYYSDRPSYRAYFDRLHPLVEYMKTYDDDFYRAETIIRRTVNDPMALGINGISHSSSTLNSRIIDFLHKLGFSSQEHWTRYKGATILTDSLLGIRYIISENVINQHYIPVHTDDGLTLFQNPYALPLGFMASSEITTLALNSLNPFDNQNLLLSTLLSENYVDYYQLLEIESIYLENLNAYEEESYVTYTPIIPDQDAFIEYTIKTANGNPMYMYLEAPYPRKVNIWKDKEYVDTFFDSDSVCIIPLGENTGQDVISLITTPIDGEYYLRRNYFYYLDINKVTAGLERLKEGAAVISRVSDRHLHLDCTAAADQILLITIPYEPGWTVRVDGVVTYPIEIMDALMGIPVSAGTHRVEMTFTPMGLKTGGIISIIALIAFVCFDAQKRQQTRKRQLMAVVFKNHDPGNQERNANSELN
jgi:uncharacterized membrane protein YfhO